ncbi:MAG: hypothetical protein ACQESR_15035 [Planctomycetota bacterium]
MHDLTTGRHPAKVGVPFPLNSIENGEDFQEVVSASKSACV